MVGFALPKLRWLVLGAMAAGGWAMIQEPPKREHWERRTALEDAVGRTGPRIKRVEAPFVDAPQKATDVVKAMLQTANPLPASTPVSGKPVAAPKPAAATQAQAQAQTGGSLLYATEKVRMRKEPSLGGSVVTTLKAAQAVMVLGAQGEWRRVSAGSKSGWVHSDYLAASAVPPKKDTLITAAVPRPKLGVGADKPALKATASVAQQPAVPALTGRPQDASAPVKPATGSLWGALRPARPPQSGDCQCPYDVMLSGKQCGDHSAYGRNGGAGVACYF